MSFRANAADIRSASTWCFPFNDRAAAELTTSGLAAIQDLGAQRGPQMKAKLRQGQIATLEARLRQLKAREQLVNARLRRLESRRARKADTRRKILVGAIVLAKVEQGVVAESQLRQWLDGALRRVDDRELFGLE
jgi:hypothetical protein